MGKDAKPKDLGAKGKGNRQLVELMRIHQRVKGKVGRQQMGLAPAHMSKVFLFE
jgi:hypothetical protein